MEKRKKNNIGVPVPKSRDKVFTVQENRILDQITLEICEAWKNDLISIRSDFHETKKLYTLLQDIYDKVYHQMEIIDKFFDKTDQVLSIKNIHQSQLSLESQISEMRSQMISVHNRLEAKSIDVLAKTVVECRDSLILAAKALEKYDQYFAEQQIKKWWKFW